MLSCRLTLRLLFALLSHYASPVVTKSTRTPPVKCVWLDNSMTKNVALLSIQQYKSIKDRQSREDPRVSPWVSSVPPLFRVTKSPPWQLTDGPTGEPDQHLPSSGGGWSLWWEGEGYVLEGCCSTSFWLATGRCSVVTHPKMVSFTDHH